MNHDAAVAEFQRDEVAYWRRRAYAAEERLRAAAEHHPGLPPEPPIGTRYFSDGEPEWERRDDGWHCAGPDCRNCPCDWLEAWDLKLQYGTWDRQLPGTARGEAG